MVRAPPHRETIAVAGKPAGLRVERDTASEAGSKASKRSGRSRMRSAGRHGNVGLESDSDLCEGGFLHGTPAVGFAGLRAPAAAGRLALQAPVPLHHDLRRVGDHHHLEAADVGAVDLALADVEAGVTRQK